ncbi:hypothetical protein KC343_g18 [Hortaea werneckii]|nr:hypothetical protein KC317_g18 [Hortaea werneckii]KAI7628692.1 hypothetical protein KC346_g19 [Hortaea werneckii]KAI7638467.1 hypothetical protein KC343_g18 [Hortaea werneckii]
MRRHEKVSFFVLVSVGSSLFKVRQIHNPVKSDDLSSLSRHVFAVDQSAGSERLLPTIFRTSANMLGRRRQDIVQQTTERVKSGKIRQYESCPRRQQSQWPKAESPDGGRSRALEFCLPPLPTPPPPPPSSLL